MIEPGIHYGLSMGEYLSIEALSAGVIITLLDACPAAARFDSPWNPQREIRSTDAQDLGTIAHALFLEGSRDGCVVIDPADHPNEKGGGCATGWTNKSIRAERERVKLAGKIPVLNKDMAAVEAMNVAARAYVDSIKADEPAIHAMFEPEGGTSEVVVIWEDGGTLCKLRADRLANDCQLIADYKSTSATAEPNRFGRTQLISLRYYVSAAWYRRGVRAATGAEPAYIFLAGEVDPPHLHSLVGCDPSLLELGDEKVGVGLRAWQECERTGVWPAYPTRVAWIAAPAYERAQWDERSGVDADGIPYDLSKLWGEPKEHPFSHKKETAA